MTQAGDLWTSVKAVREGGPLVHNIANYVAMDLAANVLLAAGASPVMAHALDEVADLAAIAGAVTVNMGTLDRPWVESMQALARAARAAGTPWVFDPVGAGATPYRTATAAQLIVQQPAVVRGNASEIIAVTGGSGGKGVDATHATAAALEAAQTLARRTGGVVAVTGAIDYVTDGVRTAECHNGDPMMAKVTATGCGLTCLIGAFVAATGDAYSGTVHAIAAYGIAGEIAAETAAGPGSFRVGLLDALHNLDEAQIDRRLRLG